MLTLASTNTAGAVTNNIQTQAFTVNGQGAFSVWSPTAMTLNTVQGTKATVTDTAIRTSQSCFFRGVSDTLRIQTNNNKPWFHRRICFCAKNTTFYLQQPGEVAPVLTYGPQATTSNGYQRYFNNLLTSGIPLTLGAIQGVLFKGALNVDWTDTITAPVDTTRVDLKYDKTRVIRSNNETGVVSERKFYHPMNKTLVYDDDETGQGMSGDTSNFSVKDKRGMGDFYIVDIISGGLGAAAADLMSINATTTVYWHEK